MGIMLNLLVKNSLTDGAWRWCSNDSQMLLKSYQAYLSLKWSS